MQIYVARDPERTGPFDLETVRAALRAGAYSPADLAWHEGASGWAPLGQIAGLENVAAPSAMPPPLPRTNPPVFPRGTVPPTGLPYRTSDLWATGSKVDPDGSRKPKIRTPLVITLAALAMTFAFVASMVLRAHRMAAIFDPPRTTAAATGTRHYVNRAAEFTDDRAAHFTNLEFDYPAAWTLASGPHVDYHANYVEASHVREIGGQSTRTEIFNVGFFYGTDGASAATALAQLAPEIMAQIEAKLPEQMRGYRKISEGPSTVGPYHAYELRAEAAGDEKDKNADGTPVKVWMRWVMVAPSDDRANGTMLVMMATSQELGIHGVEDVGTKGEMPLILNSFRFGP